MTEAPSCECFGFAFDDTDFSDWLLHIHIIPNELSPTPISEKTKHSSNSSAELQLKTLNLSSVILATKSPFFYKLFKNGITESKQKEATLRIHSSEETALMDLLKFMYTNTISANTFSDLVDVFMAADKFEVKSCIKHCIQLLLKIPMSLQSALLFLDLPSTILPTKPLIDASKEYLGAHFNDFENSKEKAMELPLVAIKIVLDSQGLRVNSEDNVYGFILKWARAHYPELKERQEILNTQLGRLICFPYMSRFMLRKVIVCRDFSGAKVSKLATEALFRKAGDPSKYFATTKTRRLYNYRLVKVVPVEFSLPRCIIFFNLKKQECKALFPTNSIFSETFRVGRHWFYILAQCEDDHLKSDNAFGVYIHVDVGSKTKACKCTLDIEWAVMKKPSNEYEIQEKENNCIVTEEEGVGWRGLFQVPWATFISDESEYFIDNVLHLRAELTIINSQP